MWVNWLLVIGGIVCVIVELALGAMTGFDLALIGGSLAIGGGIGLLVGIGKGRIVRCGRFGAGIPRDFPQLVKIQAHGKASSQQYRCDRGKDRRGDQAHRAARARHGQSV